MRLFGLHYLSLVIPPLLAASSAWAGVGPAPERIVYRADQDTDLVEELYMVDIDQPGLATKLNPPLVFGGKLNVFRVLPDGSGVVYRGEQDALFAEELFVVRFDMPGVATRISGTLPAGGNVADNFQITSGGKVVYIADQRNNNVAELFLADPDNPGVTQVLNGPLPTFGDVTSDFVISPDGNSVLYRADERTNGVDELFLVALNNPGNPVRISDDLVTFGDVSSQGYAFTPDGQKVVYIADQDTNGVNDLYAVDISNPGVSTRINGALASDGRVLPRFAFSPDSTRLAYVAFETSPDANLMLANLVTGAAPTRLSPLPATPAGVSRFLAFSADGSSVIYHAEQDTPFVSEIFEVSLAAPQSPQKLVAGHVENLYFSDDRDRLLYVTDREQPGTLNLLSYQRSSATEVTLNPPLVSRGDLLRKDPRFSPDGTRVAYRADQGENSVNELFLVELAAPGSSVRLNAPLVVDGNVVDFAFVPIADSGPDPLIFAARNGVPTGTRIYSETLEVTGINQEVAVAISAVTSTARYSLNGGPRTSSPGVVSAGDTLQLSMFSSYAPNALRKLTLNVGDGSFVWDVRTGASDTTPSSFSFDDVDNVPPGSTQLSNTVTIRNINTAVPVSISSYNNLGEYSVNGGAFGNGGGTVSSGDTITLRAIASGTPGNNRNIALEVGTRGESWSVRAGAETGDVEPFLLTDVPAAATGTEYFSNTITVSGPTGAVPISISAVSSTARYSINGGSFVSSAGTVSAGDTVQLRIYSSFRANSLRKISLTIGDESDVWDVRTGATDTTPSSFSFPDTSNADLSTLYESAVISVLNINTSVPISVSSYNNLGEYSVNGGAWTNAAGTVVAGDTVRLRMPSSGNPGTRRLVRLSVGTKTGRWSLRTANP